ncbi:MAG: hypothetical protein V1859_00995 [archaeon]
MSLDDKVMAGIFPVANACHIETGIKDLHEVAVLFRKGDTFERKRFFRVTYADRSMDYAQMEHEIMAYLRTQNGNTYNVPESLIKDGQLYIEIANGQSGCEYLRSCSEWEFMSFVSRVLLTCLPMQIRLEKAPAHIQEYYRQIRQTGDKHMQSVFQSLDECGLSGISDFIHGVDIYFESKDCRKVPELDLHPGNFTVGKYPWNTTMFDRLPGMMVFAPENIAMVYALLPIDTKRTIELIEKTEKKYDERHPSFGTHGNPRFEEYLFNSCFEDYCFFKKNIYGLSFMAGKGDNAKATHRLRIAYYFLDRFVEKAQNRVPNEFIDQAIDIRYKIEQQYGDMVKGYSYADLPQMLGTMHKESIFERIRYRVKMFATDALITMEQILPTYASPMAADMQYGLN